MDNSGRCQTVYINLKGINGVLTTQPPITNSIASHYIPGGGGFAMIMFDETCSVGQVRLNLYHNKTSIKFTYYWNN